MYWNNSLHHFLPSFYFINKSDQKPQLAMYESGCAFVCTYVPAPSQHASSPPLSGAAPSPHSASSALSPAVSGALSPVAVAVRLQTHVLINEPPILTNKSQCWAQLSAQLHNGTCSSFLHH